MSRIAFFNVPAHGHVNPTLPVVLALVQQGHKVIYYNTEEFRDKIAATGAVFRAYTEPVPTSATISEAVRDGNLANVTLLLLKMSQHLVPFVLSDLRHEKPDIVIYDSIALWGSIAAKVLDLPSVASFTHFIFEGTDRKLSPRELWFMLRKALPLLPEGFRLRRQLVQSYGQDVLQKDHLLPVRGDLNIVFTSATLQQQSTWIDESFHFVGPSINPSSRQSSEYDSDYRQQGQPLIYVSLGTIHSANSTLYRQMFHWFVDYPAKFLLSIGQHTDISNLGPIPENFMVRNHVPQLDVLPKVDLFITHGGMNSIHEGLYYGVPLVFVPQQMEQLFNAQVVEAQGAGIIVGDKPPFGRVTEAHLRTAIDLALHDDSIRREAVTIGEVLQATGGYTQAANEIATFARVIAGDKSVGIESS